MSTFGIHRLDWLMVSNVFDCLTLQFRMQGKTERGVNSEFKALFH